MGGSKTGATSSGLLKKRSDVQVAGDAAMMVAKDKSQTSGRIRICIVAFTCCDVVYAGDAVLQILRCGYRRQICMRSMRYQSCLSSM